MNRKDRIGFLLGALVKNRGAVVRILSRHGRVDDDLIDRAIDEAAERIRQVAWRHFDPDKGTACSYVHRIACRSAYFVLNELKRQPQLFGNLEADTDDFNPVDVAIRREQIADAHDALQEISAADRNTLRRWANGRNACAAHAHSERSTYYVRIHRAKDRFLRELIKLRLARIARQTTLAE